MTAPHTPITYSRVTCRRCGVQTIARTREAQTLRGWSYIDDGLSCGLCVACTKAAREAPAVEVLPVETPKPKRRSARRVETQKAQVEAAIGQWVAGFDNAPRLTDLVALTGLTYAKVRCAVHLLAKEGVLTEVPRGWQTPHYKVAVRE